VETTKAHSTTDPRAIAAEIIGPCFECNRPARFWGTPSQAQEFIDAHERLKNDKKSAKTFAMLEALRTRSLCGGCIDRMDRDRDARENARIRAQLHRKTYANGFMLPGTEACIFSKSNPEFETENPEHWKWARRTVGLLENAWICGDAGVGKTFMARCIANDTLSGGATVAELSALDINAKAGEWTFRERIDKLTKVDLLIIDDIDKPSWTPRSFEMLWNILDKRHAAKVKTLITANVEPAYLVGEDGNPGPWKRVHNNETFVSTLTARMRHGDTNICKRIKMAGSSHRVPKQSDMDGV